MIKPAQNVESTVRTQLEVLCENRNFFGIFQRTIKALSDDRAKRFKGWFWLL